MRLWHYKLIPVLPNKHLVAQWRECCAASSMYVSGKKHILIDYAWKYDIEEFRIYCALVEAEMIRRKFKIGKNSLETLRNNVSYDETNYFNSNLELKPNISKFKLFSSHHTPRYLVQCYFMFEEKKDVKMITEEEFKTLHNYLAYHGFSVEYKIQDF